MPDVNRLMGLFPEESGLPIELRPEPVEQKEYLINGEIRRWDGPCQTVISPVYVRTPQGLKPKGIGSYPLLGEAEALEALNAALDAYDHGIGLWPTMAVGDRIKHIEDFVRQMIRKRTEVVDLLMWEIGKNRASSENEFDRTVSYVLDTIEAVKELDRQSSGFIIKDGIMGQIKRSPLGVVLCMGPYNYPLNETFTTMIPALIMGNPVIFKPARYGVLIHRPLLEAFRDCFPPGVVNTVYGEGKVVVTPLMASGQVSVLAFIGTSRVAGILKKLHPQPHRLRSCLGLEAKNPAIILRDADLEMAVNECVTGTLSFNGQRCTAIKIIFVHEAIADRFTERLDQAVKEMKIGMPWEEGVTITPLPDLDRIKYFNEVLKDAVNKGAQVVNQGGGESYLTLYRPAILSQVDSSMRIYSEEQFGPIIPIVTFSEIEKPIRYVIESDYGQQVSIFGNDADEIAALIDPLVNQVCRVNINSQCQRGPDVFPFTGRKDSAELTLSVTDALRVFSIRTMVAAKNNQLTQEIFTRIIHGQKSNFLSTDFIF